MYDHARRSEAWALCAACPVATVCLWSAMVAEVDETYRYGTAGGLGPLQRRRLADRLPRTEVAEQLAQGLTEWRAGTGSPASPWRPPVPAYRPSRHCRGCGTRIRQPRAGRPQLWCSRLCYQRSTLDKRADAARNRRRWAQLPPVARQRRLEAMRARWAGLSATQRAEIAARRRQRGLRARAAS